MIVETTETIGTLNAHDTVDAITPDTNIRVASESGSRQLAAVMFTDMVGYTALMQQDEQKARTRRDRHRKVLERLIAANQGNVLQYFGDGTLSVFDSAFLAVKCALEIQTELRREPEIPVRIGLHVGDIVYEDSGVYGDAVNVASRIEAISIPGGVLFSSKVFDDIKNHPQFKSEQLGAFNFKNVNRPVEVFALTNPELAIPTAEDLQGKVPAAIRRIAVLPFVNMSGDTDNEYFSDGMTEELINAFTKVEGLDVTSRTSSFAFKGKNQDIREIGRQLNVDTILEGSVRKAGNRVRITAQLINTSDGYHLFSETYDRNLEDIFAIQDEIALEITDKLTYRLKGSEPRKELVKSRTDNLEAYNIYLRALYHWNRFTPADHRKAMSLLEESIRLDPGFAAAYSLLSSCYGVLGSTGTMLPHVAYPKSREYADKALELDPELAETYISLAIMNIFYYWDCAAADKALKKALEMKPGSGYIHKAYGMCLKAWDKQEEAHKEFELAVSLDPLSVMIRGQLAFSHFCLERYDEALAEIDRGLAIDPQHQWTLDLKGWCHLMKGENDKAIEMFLLCQELAGDDERGSASLGHAYARLGREAEARECLERLKKRQEKGNSEMLDMDFVTIYTGFNDLDNAFPHFQNMVNARLGGVSWIRHHPAYANFRADPRYQGTLDRACEEHFGSDSKTCDKSHSE